MWLLFRTKLLKKPKEFNFVMKWYKISVLRAVTYTVNWDRHRGLIDKSLQMLSLL